MRLKYYIRGIGAGVVLAALLLGICFYFGGGYKAKEKLTDDEIIARAQELGMVMDESNQADEEQKDGDVEETSDVDDTNTDVTTSAEAETQVDEDMTLEEYIEEAEAAAPEPEDTTISYQAFTVSSGQSSEMIASNLYRQGLVDDSASFNKYLNELGVDDRIQSGTFYVQVGSSYDDIVALLVNKDVRTTTPPEN